MLKVYNSEGEFVAKCSYPSVESQESFKARVSKERWVTITRTEKKIVNGKMVDVVTSCEDWCGGKKLDS